MNTKNSPPNIFIVGTDTNVGKTVVSLLLMQYYYHCGYKPFYLKPLQTGCKHSRDISHDARFIYQHIADLESCDPSNSVIHCFKEPKAPWFAARNELSDIHYQGLIEAINQNLYHHSPVVIEGAGGLMVPINKTTLMIDLLAQIDAIPLLVARAGLGTINHTLLSIDVMKSRHIRSFGIVLSDSETPSVSDEMISENIEAIENFSGIKVLGVIKKVNDFFYPSDNCFEVFEKMNV
ncbi:MAG: dethiobiotin synthase [Candidatus Magnetomorum sp.]|nr:dethiobiotin synthase [Candidatus Magnetomorum sp.]